MSLETDMNQIRQDIEGIRLTNQKIAGLLERILTRLNEGIPLKM
jgi:hypothetical protein